MTRETSSGHKLKEELFKYYDLYIEQISGLGEIENKERNSFLPVAICGFSIRKFQGIKNLTQIGLPLSSSWIFLTGENGFGKTSLLRAILLGLAGDEGTGLTSDELDENARMVIHYKKNKDFRISAHRSNYFERLNAVAAYGSIRTRLEEYSSSKPKVTDSLFDKGTTLLNIEEKIKELDGSKSPVLRNTKKEIIKALKTVLPNLASIEVVENVNESKKELTYKEKSGNDTKTYREVSFREMAASMRSIIAMVGDIYLRLSKEKDVKDFNKLSGIVLIDELDLHLHPKWLKKLPGLLSEVFPKVQFIASTHSPIPLLGAPKGSVVLNVTRSAEKGIQVQRLDDKVYMEHLLPNTILTSPIFGMDDIISENRDKSVHIRYEDHYDDVKLNDVIRKKLDDYMNNEKEKELLNLIKKKNG
ncbi:MAG: hypothetical protein DRI57_07885 [Deltaproteobacteria bacterium]|nr:MAG: hypothetical protein DRI57_07885 [Deltaproteobacteria bacterium]